MKRYRINILLVITLLIMTIGSGIPVIAVPNIADLGVAQGFNIFVLGNMEKSHADCEGRIAIGGNAKLSEYTIGSRLDISNTRPDLIVNGTVDLKNVRMQKGMLAVSTSSQIIDCIIDYQHQLTEAEKAVPLKNDYIDFSAAGTYLKNLSSYWGSLSPNGSISYKYSALELKGSNTDYNVFTLNPKKISEYD